MITLKYTQSNSVCYVKDGQAIGIGQGSSQESIVHVLPDRRQTTGGCVKARKCFGLQFKDGIGRADRDNAIDLYIGDEYMDLLADGVWKIHLQ